MNFLVLGGAGFLGSHLCRRLVADGHKVRIFEKKSVSFSNVSDLSEKIEWVEGDFTSSEDITTSLVGMDVVIHLISTTLPKNSNDDTIYDVSSNTISTLRLLDCACKQGIAKVLFFSSGGTVYGAPQSIPTPEDSLTYPLCSYGIHKLTIEKYLHLYYHLHGLDYGVLRLSNPYGEGQAGSLGQGVIPAFTRKILNKEPIEIWGDGSVVRDYIYIDDVIEAVVAILNYRGEYKVFNIGSGVGLSLLEVAGSIAKTLDQPYDVKFLESRKLDVPVNILDISRAKTQLKWSPRISFEEGLKRTIGYFINTNV